MSDSTDQPSRLRRNLGDQPFPLLLAAGLVAFEGLVVVVLAMLELANVSVGRLTMGLTTALFFAAYGTLLIACSWLILRGQTWTRGPMLMAQLMQLGIAWNLRSGGTLPVAMLIAAVSIVVIVTMVHPATIAAIEKAEHDSRR